jgi:hypothetical protein
VLSDARAASRPADHPTSARWPAWPLLVIVAGVLWPLEIASRRFTPPAPRLPTTLRRRAAAGEAETDRRSETADRLLEAARSRRSSRR